MKAVKFVYVIRKQNQDLLFWFSLAHEVNKTVAMNLKKFRNGYILHLEGHTKRFSVGTIIYSKRKVFIYKVFKHWIVLFGPPSKFIQQWGIVQQ